MLSYKIKRFTKDVLGWDTEGKLSRSAWLYRSKPNLEQFQSTSDSLIISLTTIPSRVSRVHVTIESIFRQTIKPRKVVLWLSAQQFDDLNRLPVPLRRQMTRGLEVYKNEKKWPHKKLLPSLVKWPTATIVTADDDVIYPSNWLEDLYSVHQENPGVIVCRRARRMDINHSGVLAGYETWPLNGEQLIHPAHSIFPTGVGGILYPSGVLHRDVHDITMAEKLCPHADDIWFKIMAFRKGTKCVATSTGMDELPGLHGSQSISLYKDNLFGGGNNKQLNAIMKYFDIKAKNFFENM